MSGTMSSGGDIGIGSRLRNKRKKEEENGRDDKNHKQLSSSKGPKKKKEVPPFVAIHLGAGDYSLSESRKEQFKNVCKKACLEAMKILRQGGSADEAVTIATVILEDSKLFNAGVGSSLTMDKRVECDAGFMNGDGYFGGVGAVPGVRNPILVARKIADSHRDKPLLSCGRIPPLLLCGPGAKLWAESVGIPVFDDSEIISVRSEKSYLKYKQRLNSVNDDHSEDCMDEVSDTVGAIALDMHGNVASTVSSGGNWLKHSGRLGHAPLFGNGCWAFKDGAGGSSIAVSSSGAGEMLTKIQIPRRIGENVRNSECLGLVDAVSTVIKKEFLENALLNCHQERRNIGVIALSWCEGHGEFVWGHSSKCFAFAHLGSTPQNSVKVQFSELAEDNKKSKGKTEGPSLTVTGVVF